MGAPTIGLSRLLQVHLVVDFGNGILGRKIAIRSYGSRGQTDGLRLRRQYDADNDHRHQQQPHRARIGLSHLGILTFYSCCWDIQGDCLSSTKWKRGGPQTATLIDSDAFWQDHSISAQSFPTAAC